MNSEDAGVLHPDGSYDLIYTEEELCEDLRCEHASQLLASRRADSE